MRQKVSLCLHHTDAGNDRQEKMYERNAHGWKRCAGKDWFDIVSNGSIDLAAVQPFLRGRLSRYTLRTEILSIL